MVARISARDSIKVAQAKARLGATAYRADELHELFDGDICLNEAGIQLRVMPTVGMGFVEPRTGA